MRSTTSSLLSRKRESESSLRRQTRIRKKALRAFRSLISRTPFRSFSLLPFGRVIAKMDGIVNRFVLLPRRVIGPRRSITRRNVQQSRDSNAGKIAATTVVRVYQPFVPSKRASSYKVPSFRFACFRVFPMEENHRSSSVEWKIIK